MQQRLILLKISFHIERELVPDAILPRIIRQRKSMGDEREDKCQ